MDISVFIELSIVVIIAVVVSGIMRLFKQPLIIGYILAGIIVSPYMLNIVRSTDAIATFAQMGIVLLLFMVGLNLNPKMIKDVGKVSLITGVGQVLFTSLIGFFICKLLDFSTIVSIYIAVALAFSSTIIIMKLLSDKGDLETLYGRIATGFLIVQDLIVIVILIFISSIPTGINFTTLVFETILKGVGLSLLLFLISTYIFPRITRIIAKSQEFLLLFSIGWCLALATLFYHLNFSIEAGALIAGITLSLSPYHYEISSKMKPLRDFFVVLFFILLGSQMVFIDISQYIIPIIVLSVFILIGNPLIVITLMGLLGYTKRNSFLAGLTVAQISEFSLILIALGIKMGHLTNEVLSIVTIIGLITIAGSTYLILYANKIYSYLSKYLKIFERRDSKIDEHKYYKDETYDVIIFGCKRTGQKALRTLRGFGKKVLVIDYDPEIIHKLKEQDVSCIYGDIDDIDLLERIRLGHINMIISTVDNEENNYLMLDAIKQQNGKALVYVVAHDLNTAVELYKRGAHHVIIPRMLGGEWLAEQLSHTKGDNYTIIIF